MEMKHIQDIMNDWLYNMRKGWEVFKDCVYTVYLSTYAHAVVISKLQRNVKDLDVRVTEVTNGTYDITMTFDTRDVTVRIKKPRGPIDTTTELIDASGKNVTDTAARYLTNDRKNVIKTITSETELFGSALTRLDDTQSNAQDDEGRKNL
jgi:hypothetical protein